MRLWPGQNLRRAKVVALPHVVATHLDDFRGTLGKDTDRARGLLAKLIGHIMLRRRDDRLVAEVAGTFLGSSDWGMCAVKMVPGARYVYFRPASPSLWLPAWSLRTEP